MLDVFGMAFIHVKKRPLRSALTILQMMLGIATVALVFNLVFGLWDGVQKLESGVGSSTYELMVGQETVSADGMHVSTHITTSITSSGLQRIKEQVDTIRSISPVNDEWERLVKVDGTFYKINRLAHVGAEFLDVVGASMTTGTFFTESDCNQGNKVCVVASKAVGILFPGTDPIGKTVEIYRSIWTMEGEVLESEEYTVVGVYDSGLIQDGYSNMLGNQILVPIALETRPDTEFTEVVEVTGTSGGGVAMISGGKTVATSWTAMDNVSVSEQRFNSVVLSIEEGQFATTQSALTAIVKDLYGDENDAILRKGDMYTQGLGDIVRILSMVMGGFGLLIVVIGSIGILSTMIVNVLERTRQIGIEKALGASRRTIFVKLTAEAVLMSFAGGILGLVLAYFVWNYIVDLIRVLPVHLDAGLHPMAILMALFVAVVAGWIFGMYPALQASKLHPTEALRQK